MEKRNQEDMTEKELQDFVKNSSKMESLKFTPKSKEKKSFFKNIFSSKKKGEDEFVNDYGILANILFSDKVKMWRKKYPEIFTPYLKKYRLANMNILSSTFIAMAILTSILAICLSFLIFLVLFFYYNDPLLYVILKSIFFSIVIGGITLLVFYMYPDSEIKKKKQNIETNLPFVIDHMSAISTSGIAPIMIFQLIANTEQYGEISVQIKKIIKYVEIFGHDLITAIKAVGATIPSENFKEFLEGFVTTVETGGELDTYLSQKADESMVQYRLNREKYIQTISTYSDVYTGLLIAAPLFFVASLTLMSLLGGDIMGIPIETLMLVGIYVLVPAMNFAFLGFLKMSQLET